MILKLAGKQAVEWPTDEHTGRCKEKVFHLSYKGDQLDRVESVERQASKLTNRQPHRQMDRQKKQGQNERNHMISLAACS